MDRSWKYKFGGEPEFVCLQTKASFFTVFPTFDALPSKSNTEYCYGIVYTERETELKIFEKVIKTRPLVVCVFKDNEISANVSFRR